LETIDLFSGTQHGLKTDLESIDLIGDLTSLLSEELFVEVNQFEERCWSGVVVSSLLGQEKLVGFTNGQVNLSHVGGDSLVKVLLWEFDFGQETLSDIDQGFTWPLMEPIH